MLQRLNFPLDEELSCGDGLWSRNEFEQMNDVFTRAVSRALSSGHESHVAASATVQIGRNGNRRLAEDAAIGAVWDLLWSKQGDMTALEVLGRVRAVCPHVTAEQVREGFRWRLMEIRG